MVVRGPLKDDVGIDVGGLQEWGSLIFGGLPEKGYSMLGTKSPHLWQTFLISCMCIYAHTESHTLTYPVWDESLGFRA